ncbi:MAG: glutathione S-transferase family protein [Lautropia sp.]
MKLYYAKGSCALASHIALEEAGARYQATSLDFAKAEQAEPAYRAINPKGRVPALVTDAGVLTETPAILAYVAQTHPAAALAPLGDPFEFARVQAFNSYLCATVHVAHAHIRRAARWADSEEAQAAMRAKVPQNMADCFRLIEETMLAGPWVMGDRYTICDPYLYTVSGWLARDGVDIADFPGVRAHRERMDARPAVQRVAPLYAN